MKTRTRYILGLHRRPSHRSLRWRLGSWVIAWAGVCFFGTTAWAEMSDPRFETELRERKRDFDRYVKARPNSSSTELKAAEALREARKKREAQLRDLEVDFQKKSKRYSMEEVETLDRVDEERLAKRDSKAEEIRASFVKTRDRRRAIEASIAPVDTYQEFDINMQVEPESKTSHVGVDGSQTVP